MSAGRITESMLSTRLLSDLNDITSKMQHTQEEMSSGKQILQPSDDPFGTQQALQFRGDLAQNVQYQANVNSASSWQDATDTALGQISQLVQRARDLTVQGANDPTGSAGRQSAAAELDQIIESIKEIGNTQYAGRYIFAGSKTTTQPYTLNGADTYNGDAASITAEIGVGVQMPLNVAGSSVIGDGSTAGSLLATLRQISSDLTSNNSTALQNGDLSALDAANDNVTNMQATVGARSDRLTTALSRLQQLQESTTKVLSQTEDVDMAQAMVDFSQQQAVYQSALKSGAMIVQPSLMDFLS